MKRIAEIVLALSLSGSLVILFLLFIKPLLKDRTSKRWQYYIWLIALLRLLLPFTPEISPIGILFHTLDKGSGQTDVTFYEENIEVLTQKEEGLRPTAHSTDTLNSSTSTFSGTVGFLTAFLPYLWFLWIVLLMRKVTLYQSFVRYVKAGSIEVSDIAILDRLAVIAEQAGVKKPVELYCNPLVSTPLLIGFFRPCIVLPSMSLPDSDFQYTVLHELTHYKRGDMFYKWLVQITLCLHWFNPLVYLMEHEISRLCELSCDEAIIRKLDSAGQHAYGDTLLHALGIGGRYKDSLASVTLNESKELLKERLETIMKFHQKKGLMIPVAALATIFLCSCASAVGTYLPFNNDLENIEAALFRASASIANETPGREAIHLKGDEKGSPAAFAADSSGILEIPFHIDKLSPYSEICIGAVPDLVSAQKILYQVQVARGTNLYIGLRLPDEGNLILWSNYMEGYSRINYESEDTVYSSMDYTGNYYIYVGSQNNKLSDITGTVRITYETGSGSSVKEPETGEGRTYMTNFVSSMDINSCHTKGTVHQEKDSTNSLLASVTVTKNTEIIITGTLNNKSGNARLVYTSADGIQTTIAEGSDGTVNTSIIVEKGSGIFHFAGDNIICDFDLTIKITDLLHCQFRESF